MKAIDIALKDMLQAFRNRTALIFMFVVPVLVTIMFVFLFGGLGGQEMEISTIHVQVVNLDAGEENLGEMLVQGLESDEVPIPIEVTRAADAASARRAVDFQEAAVAVIIPENFSAAMMQPQGQAEVELYQDPTLTLGPSIVASLVNSFVDGFSGAKITTGIAINQLIENGQFFNPAEIQTIVDDYIAASTSIGDPNALLEVSTPSGEEGGGLITNVVQMVMAGMLIFYAFFTGANMVFSILKEEEEGTLARLFTTPTARYTVLYGKFMAAGVTVLVQVLVLFIFGALAFDFDWGDPLPVLLVSLGIALSSATFGVFLISLLKSSRQAGVALGGGVTLTGMVGMVRIFTLSVPNPPEAVTIMSYLVPQGWALSALTTSIDRGSLGVLLTSFGVLLVWSVAFFLIGNQRFKRRFA